MAAQPKITPLPSNAPPFAHEFTKRMRGRKDVSKKPSVRQTTSIPQLLSARFFRNGKLTLEDFLEAAVFTTYPPDQDIAREIAEDILLGREKVERHDLAIRSELKQPKRRHRNRQMLYRKLWIRFVGSRNLLRS